MKLGDRLRMWRLAAGLSTTQAGRAARLNQSYISQLENGRHTPSGTALLSLAGAYGCEVAQLLTGEPELQAATAAAILQRVDRQAAENSRRELAEALQAARAAENAAALARAEFEAELARLREHLAQIEANTEHGFKCLESRLDTAALVGEQDMEAYGDPDELTWREKMDWIDQQALRYGRVHGFDGAGDGDAFIYNECERRGYEYDGGVWYVDVGDAGGVFDQISSLEEIPLDDCDPCWRALAGHHLYLRMLKTHGYAAANRAYGKYADPPEVHRNTVATKEHLAYRKSMKRSGSRANSMVTPEDKALRRLQLGGATC